MIPNCIVATASPDFQLSQALGRFGRMQCSAGDCQDKSICIQIEGAIPSASLEVLREEYGPYLLLRVDPIERMVDVMHAPLYARVQKELRPGSGRNSKGFRARISAAWRTGGGPSAG